MSAANQQNIQSITKSQPDCGAETSHPYCLQVEGFPVQSSVASIADALTLKRSSSYRPELDALRFFAFLCVFCSHLLNFPTWYIPIFHMGSLGLSIFFLLSSFLIVTLLLNEKAAFEKIHVRSFFARRVLRIWPLYFFMISLAVLLGAFIPTQQIHKLGFLYMLLMVGNFFILKHGWMLGVLNPLWSISVEEQFYIMAPWLGQYLSRRRLAIFFILVLLIAYATLFYLGRQHELFLVGVWANSFVQFQFFAAGALLAIVLQQHSLRYGGAVRAAIFLAGIACWYISAMRFHIHTFHPSTWLGCLGAYSSALLGALLIFLSVLDIGISIPEPLIYLGKISYGLYVFHQFFINAATEPAFLLGSRMPGVFIRHRSVALTAAMGATIVTASMSYRFLESPFLRLKRRFEFLRTRPV